MKKTSFYRLNFKNISFSIDWTLKQFFLRNLFSSKYYMTHHVTTESPCCSEKLFPRIWPKNVSKSDNSWVSCVTIYESSYNFVGLTWQQFKSITLISWGLFVATTHMNTKLLSYNHIGHLMFEKIVLCRLFWWKMQEMTKRLNCCGNPLS